MTDEEALEIARGVLAGKTRSHVGSAALLAAHLVMGPTRPDGLPLFHDLRLAGWNCRAPGCGVFTGEEKELQLTCRACGAPRPRSYR